MKKILIFLACIFTLVSSKGQSALGNPIDEALRLAIYDIIELSIAENIKELDRKYVHSNFGVYDVHRIGIPDTFKRYTSLEFAFPKEKNTTMYPNLSEVTRELLALKLINYEAAYDCNEMEWDKSGLFISNSDTSPKLSEMIKWIDFKKDELPKDFEKKALYIEENSCRVVLTQFDIIFCLTKIDDAWYLTLFDRVSTDCSA